MEERLIDFEFNSFKEMYGLKFKKREIKWVEFLLGEVKLGIRLPHSPIITVSGL
jgi:hypothetical protein